jgi:Flp pilus assembly protein TadG
VKAPSIGGRLCACLRSGGRGQSLVEFAFMLPLLLMVITGIFWLGIAIYNYQQLCAAVSQGVVALAEGQNTGTNPCSNAVSIVTTDTQGMIPNSNSLSVTIYEDGTAVAPASCLTSLTTGTPVSVQATYQYTLPIVGTSFTDCCTLSSTQYLSTP